MFTVKLVVSVGKIVKGQFHEADSYDLEVDHYNDPYMSDNVNDILNVVSDPAFNYAQLRMHVSGMQHNGFLVATFNKSKSNWILGDR